MTLVDIQEISTLKNTAPKDYGIPALISESYKHVVRGSTFFMKIIKIKSPKYGEFDVKVDDEDFDRLSKFKWHINKHVCTGTFYTSKKPTVSCKYMSMHRHLMNPADDEEVDHIDLDKLNNQKSNLRIATHAQNNMNKNLQSNSTSGFKGVHYRLDRKKYECYIWVDKKKIHAPYFKTAIEAAKKYNEMALKYHGEFARLNVIPNE